MWVTDVVVDIWDSYMGHCGVVVDVWDYHICDYGVSVSRTPVLVNVK